MKKQNSRRLLLVAIALFVAVGLVVVSAAASVLAYRQFVGREKEQANVVLDGLQVDESQQEESQGVLILYVEPDSPAAQAGLDAGTVIRSVNGREVNSPQELKDAIAEYEVGETITLTVDVSGETTDVAVTLGDSGPYLGVNVGSAGGLFRFHGEDFGRMPHGFVVPRFPDDSTSPDDPDAPEGMLPFDFDEDHGRFFDLLGNSALVMSVAGETPAAEAGLQAGDAITEANGQTIEDSQQLIDLIAELSPGDQLTLQVQRGTETISIEVTLASHPDDEGRAYLGVFLASGHLRQELDFFQEQQNS